MYVRFVGGVEVEIEDAVSWRAGKTDLTLFDIAGQAIRMYPREALESYGFRPSVEDAKAIEVPLEVLVLGAGDVAQISPVLPLAL